MSSSSTLNAMPNTPPGNSRSSSKPTPGRPLTLAMPVEMFVIVPTSCGLSCGVKVRSECRAKHSTRNLQKLLKADAGEAADPGDACGNVRDRAHLVRPQLRSEGLPHLAYSGKRAVEDTLQALRRSAHWLFVSGLGSSGLGAALVSGSGSTLVSGLGSALTSGLGSTLASGLSFSFRSSPTPFSRDAR